MSKLIKMRVDVCAPTSEFGVPEEKQGGQEGHEERVRAKCGCVHEIGVEPWRPYAFLPDTVLGETFCIFLSLNGARLNSSNDDCLALNDVNQTPPDGSTPPRKGRIVYVLGSIWGIVVGICQRWLVVPVVVQVCSLRVESRRLDC